MRFGKTKAKPNKISEELNCSLIKRRSDMILFYKLEEYFFYDPDVKKTFTKIYSNFSGNRIIQNYHFLFVYIRKKKQN